MPRRRQGALVNSVILETPPSGVGGLADRVAGVIPPVGDNFGVCITAVCLAAAAVREDIHALVQSAGARQVKVYPYVQVRRAVPSADPAPGYGHAPRQLPAVYAAVDPYLRGAVGGEGSQLEALIGARRCHSCASVDVALGV